MSKNAQGDHLGYQQDIETRGLLHAAATATETKGVYIADRKCRLRKVNVIPDANVTGQATDYTTLQAAVNGVAKGSALAFSSAGVTMTAGVKTAIFGADVATPDAAIQLSANDVVQLVVTKTGLGLAIPDGIIHVVIDFES